MHPKVILKFLPAVSICALLFAFILSESFYAAAPSYAFARSDSTLVSGYRSYYGWDEEKTDSYTWTGDDGKEHTRRSTGYQREAFEDILDALIAQLEEQGYSLDLTDGSGEDTSSVRCSQGMVSVALKEVGKERSAESPAGSNNVFYNSWFYGKDVSGEDYTWCGVFIAWCAGECGYLDSELFLKTSSCQRQYRYLTGTQGFSANSVQDIRQFGGDTDAYTGDIVLWRDGTEFVHMGIVTDISDASVDITQGDCTGRVCTVRYVKDNLKENNALRNGYIVHVVYPSFSFDAQGGEIQDTVFLFLTKEMGLNSASACGLLGNFQAECGWNIDAVGDNGTSYGLCQWHEDRWKRLITFCASNGYDPGTLEGQLRYLEYELTETDESSTLSYLEGISDNESGAVSAAKIFAQRFERCTKDSYSERQQYASLYWQIYGGK